MLPVVKSSWRQHAELALAVPILILVMLGALVACVFTLIFEDVPDRGG